MNKSCLTLSTKLRISLQIYAGKKRKKDLPRMNWNLFKWEKTSKKYEEIQAALTCQHGCRSVKRGEDRNSSACCACFLACEEGQMIPRGVYIGLDENNIHWYLRPFDVNLNCFRIAYFSKTDNKIMNGNCQLPPSFIRYV